MFFKFFRAKSKMVLLAAFLTGFMVFGAFAGEGTLTVYSGRSRELVGPVFDKFTEETGVDVRVLYASTPEIAATILEEGRASPADVFYAQEISGLVAIQREGILTEIPDSVMKQVDPRFRSPNNRWVGVTARIRVAAFNTESLSQEALPESIWGFTDPEWRGRLGWAPTNASFQAMVTTMRLDWGEEKTKEWLRKIKKNEPKFFPKNTPILSALGAGEIEVGFTNHYYLYRFLEERGAQFPVQNYHFREANPGSTLLVSGAGILETAQNTKNAERFLEFVVSPQIQEYFADETFEYPGHKVIKPGRGITPLREVVSSETYKAGFKDLEATISLLRRVGVLS